MTAKRASDENGAGDADDPAAGSTDVRSRRAARKTAATAAAAAMDEIDAEEFEDLTAGRSQSELEAIFARYRELPAVSERDLAVHVRGGTRVEDGKTHQVWDWTNADICRWVRPILEKRFADLPPHRELAEDMGFDDHGNRVVAVAGGSDEVVAKADDRFNDIYRLPTGQRRYGTNRGLLLPELQLLRTRYWRLENEEVVEGKREEDKRRYAAQYTLFVLFLLAFAGLMVVILSL